MNSELSTYQRLQNELRALITNLPKGTKLPAEPQLAEQLAVSRATLREVLRIFESQGLLRRKQGLGTFVIGPTRVIESGLEALESIETLADRIGLDVTMGDSKIIYTQADEKLTRKLNLAPGETIVDIRRVILTDDIPVAYLIDILPKHVINQETLKNQFSGSVLDLIIKVGQPRLSISKTEISAVHAQPVVAKALDIQRGDTLLQLEALLFDDERNPIDFSYSYFIPGYFRLHIIRKIGGINR